MEGDRIYLGHDCESLFMEPGKSAKPCETLENDKSTRKNYNIYKYWNDSGGMGRNVYANVMWIIMKGAKMLWQG